MSAFIQRVDIEVSLLPSISITKGGCAYFGIKNMKKIMILLLALCLCIGAVFADESYSDWAKKEVQEALKLDLVPERLQNHYRANITRDEFCELIIRCVYKNKIDRVDSYQDLNSFQDGNISLHHQDNPFDDLNYEKHAIAHIITSYHLGIVNGKGENKFAPDDFITRQEAAKIICDAYEYMLEREHLIEQFKSSSASQTFSDDSKIANWAKKYVYQVSGEELMGTTGNDYFSPDLNITREQAILTAMRTFKKARLKKNMNPEPILPMVNISLYRSDVDDTQFKVFDSFIMSPKEIRLPYIHLQSEDAKLVNETIHEMFKEWIKIYKKAYKESQAGDTPFFITADYMFTQAKDFLSVLIIQASHGSSPTMYDYSSFNFDLKNGKKMSARELMKFASVDANKLKNYLTNHIHETIKAFRTLYGVEMINDRDLDDSIEQLEENHQKSNYTFFIEDKNNPKILTLPYSYIGSPAGDGSINDILKIRDTGNSQLVQSVIDNITTYPGKPLAVAIYLPVGEDLKLTNPKGIPYQIRDFRPMSEHPSEILYLIPLQDVKILIKEIEWDGDKLVEKTLLDRIDRANPSAIYRTGINVSSIPNKKFVISNKEKTSDFILHENGQYNLFYQLIY